jgi:hypothetical protein
MRDDGRADPPIAPLVVGSRTHFDELRHAIGATLVHAVQQQAVKMYVEVGG